MNKPTYVGSALVTQITTHVALNDTTKIQTWALQGFPAKWKIFRENFVFFAKNVCFAENLAFYRITFVENFVLVFFLENRFLSLNSFSRESLRNTKESFRKIPHFFAKFLIFSRNFYFAENPTVNQLGGDGQMYAT